MISKLRHLNRAFAWLSFSFTVSSCAPGGHFYSYEEGRYLDFSIPGKWLLLDVKTNQSNQKNKLNRIALEEFRVILGDSVFEEEDVRIINLTFLSKIKTVNDSTLKILQDYNQYRFLIAIESKTSSKELGNTATNIPNGSAEFNKVHTSIEIFDVSLAKRISRTSAYSQVEDRPRDINESQKSFPRIARTSEKLQEKAIIRLIRRYNKNRLDSHPSKTLKIGQ